MLVAGQGATKTVWGPDLLSSLAQGRQVVVFDNRFCWARSSHSLLLLCTCRCLHATNSLHARRGIGESLDPSSGMYNYTIAPFAGA